MTIIPNPVDFDIIPIFGSIPYVGESVKWMIRWKMISKPAILVFISVRPIGPFCRLTH